MASTPPPTNSKAVWFTPRDDPGDKILYYLRDGRSSKHAGLAPLTPHPLAASNPIYEGLVFLNRTPADDDEAGLVKDWYGPSSLVDDLLSVRDAGGGYESSLLYARGTTPPDEDTRIDVLGRQTLGNIGPVGLAWVNDPLTSSPGIDLVLLTDETGGSLALQGDEVYIVIDSGDMKDLEPIFGLNVRSKRLKIARHISSTSVHVEIPYNSSVNLSSVYVAADVYEALYLLDGYTDAESAPGVLADLFHTRTFSYRLAEPSYSSEWDDSLGLEILTESRLMPYSWASLLNGTPTALAIAEKTISYEMVSKNLTMRTKREVVVGDGPTQNGITWKTKTRITVPAICTEVYIPWTWAYTWVFDDEGSKRQDYSQAWAVTKTMINAHEVGVTASHLRHIVPQSEVSALVDAIGNPFSFRTQTYSFGVCGWFWFYGANIGTGAGVRVGSIGPCLLSGGRLRVRNRMRPSPDSVVGLEAREESQNEGTGSRATATVTITDYAELNPGDKVNLIAADGTNYDFTNGSQSSVAGTWESTTSNAQTAANLMNVINTSSGPSLSRFSASVAGAVVTITQTTSGLAGNKVVTLTDTGTAGMSKTDFTGGAPWSAAGDGLKPGESTVLRGQKVQWGNGVVWDVKVQKARWGYWMVDVTTITLPSQPRGIGMRFRNLRGTDAGPFSDFNTRT